MLMLSSRQLRMVSKNIRSDDNDLAPISCRFHLSTWSEHPCGTSWTSYAICLIVELMEQKLHRHRHLHGIVEGESLESLFLSDGSEEVRHTYVCLLFNGARDAVGQDPDGGRRRRVRAIELRLDAEVKKLSKTRRDPIRHASVSMTLPLLRVHRVAGGQER